MKDLKKKIALAAVGAGIGTASQLSFAQASGVDVTATVTSIGTVIPAIVSIGTAVLGVVVVGWGYRFVKGFLGR